MESNGGILYETLDSFSFFSNPNPTPSESNAVFRNQITSSVDLSVDIPVADYFSFDVAAESPPRDAEESPPLPPVDDQANGESKASELAWFRAGSKLKSPMIHLHKDKENEPDLGPDSDNTNLAPFFKNPSSLSHLSNDSVMGFVLSVAVRRGWNTAPEAGSD